MGMKWLTVSINPPPLDGVIVVRSANLFDLGRSYEVIQIDPKVMEYEDLTYYLGSNDFIEWGCLDDE